MTRPEEMVDISLLWCACIVGSSIHGEQAGFAIHNADSIVAAYKQRMARDFEPITNVQMVKPGPTMEEIIRADQAGPI